MPKVSKPVKKAAPPKK
jgi:hypothetical protein